jgi:hypothetical protein
MFDLHQQEPNSSSLDASLDASGNDDDVGLDSQAQPLEISSSDRRYNSESRKSSCVRRATRIVKPQLLQIKKGLIPAPSTKA